MKIYENGKMKNIYCNSCGKKIKIKNEVVQEGIFEAEIKWGYFSNKDGRKDEFDVCEKCYDAIVEKFLYKPDYKDYTELL